MVLSELQPAKEKTVSLSSHMASQPFEDPSSATKLTKHIEQRSLLVYSIKNRLHSEVLVLSNNFVALV